MMTMLADIGAFGACEPHKVGASRWYKQTWTSIARPVDGYDKGATLRVHIRFDDKLNNGHSTFSVTGTVRVPRQGEVAGGCLHDDIAKVFPELAHLIRWHLVSTDGPMHYVANTVYHASDRDYNGLRKGEARPIVNRRTGQPVWELVAVNEPGVQISDTPTGKGMASNPVWPLYILTTHADGETPPATPRLEWARAMRVGEGKARELDHARSCAVWPEVTDDELTSDGLAERLAARLPALLAAFRADIENAGLKWAPRGG